MKKFEYLSAIMLGLFLTSCVTNSRWWSSEERGTLAVFPLQHVLQKLISVPLNPRNQLEGRFELYYFVKTPGTGKAKKSVLFVSGGPGQVVNEPNSKQTYADFLSNNEFNVVYFHLRGSGLSQIHPSNEFDKYLRTSYAVEDIEEIRQDLVRGGFMRDDGKWDAIVAWSYGTVLTHMYAYLHERKVDKLVLIAPLPRTSLSEPNQAHDILRRSLENIYGAKDRLLSLVQVKGQFRSSIRDPRAEEFSDLTLGDKKRIIDEIFGSTNEVGIREPGIMERAENAFGNVQFVVDHYAELKKSGELSRYWLQKYDCSVFQQLRLLRLYGWYGSIDALHAQRNIGKILRDGIIKDSVDGKSDCRPEESSDPNSSARAFYTINNRDGISGRFVKEWLVNGRSDVRGALRKSAGEAHENRSVNDSIEKVGIDVDEIIEPWDPLRYKHNRPTLILSGEADPIATAAQISDFHKNALSGSRTLIPFPGVGHEISLPRVSRDIRGLSGSLILDRTRILPKGVRTITATINGLAHNKNLALQLIPPNDLEAGLRVVGFGRAVGTQAAASNKVVVLVENGTRSEVQSSAKVWKIVNEFFSGTVTLNPGKMNPGENKLLEGPVVFTGANPRYRINVHPPASLSEANIDLACAQFVGEKLDLELFLHNRNTSAADLPFERWIVMSEFFKTSFFMNRTLDASKTSLMTEAGIVGIDLPREARWNWDQKKCRASRRACLSA